MHKLAIMEAGPHPGGYDYEFEGEAATCNQVNDPTKVVTVNEEVASRTGEQSIVPSLI